jgi:DNA-directed RNA polymerase subunit M/transcription elongation factor TFIIS
MIFPDFILDQSKSIAFSVAHKAQMSVSREDTIFEIDRNLKNMVAAFEMEKGIFEYSMLYIETHNMHESMFKSVYEYKLNELIRNMDFNPELKTAMASGHIKPRMLAFLHPTQLCPQKWQVLLSKQQANEERKNNLPTTNTYKCRKCGERKCTVSMLQTRSADEPMTIFIRCCVCYNTWTI